MSALTEETMRIEWVPTTPEQRAKNRLEGERLLGRFLRSREDYTLGQSVL